MNNIVNGLSKLLNLNEAASDRQSKIVDSQSDVKDDSLKDEVNNKAEGIDKKRQDVLNSKDENNSPSEDLMGMEDLESTPSSEENLDTQKRKNLFRLMKYLISYSNNFHSTLEKLDSSLFDSDIFSDLKKYMEHLTSVKDKIRVYLVDIFNSESYERSLYSYILFRTELLTLIDAVSVLIKKEK